MVDKKCGTLAFSVKFPFSWIVKETIDSLLEKCPENLSGECYRVCSNNDLQNLAIPLLKGLIHFLVDSVTCCKNVVIIK